MKTLYALAIAASVAFVLAILIAPAFAGPDRAKCHSHNTHTHCH